MVVGAGVGCSDAGAGVVGATVAGAGVAERTCLIKTNEHTNRGHGRGLYG